MKHCSECGSPLAHGPPVECAKCRTSHWRNPKPAAATLVVSNEKLLLVRRAHDPWKKLWCAPSGFCDFDEHPIATAERETLEETGIQVEITGYLGTWLSYYAEDDVMGTGRSDDIVIAVAYYHAVPAPAHGARAPSSTEVSDVEWFGWRDLPHDVAPPGAFPAIAGAWREAFLNDGLTSPLPDRPRPARASST